MDDFICQNCGFQGAPEGTVNCPQCGQSTMTPVDELGKDTEHGPSANPNQPESLEDLEEDELEDSDDEEDDDL